MPTPRRIVTFRVKFSDGRFAEDLDRCRPEGQRAARQARVQLERDGVPQHLLTRCAGEHRDGTDLPGMVKLYLPMPYGPWGLVLQGTTDDAGLHLLAVAFGERHPDRRPTVYDIAHYRQHGRWPAGMRSDAGG
jgi:hypothetical protein